MARRRRNERGFALVMVAISATTLLGFLPLAIDLGRLAFTANEVQAVADVAATAGATYLMTGQDAATARSQARAVVAENRVAGAAASIPQDSDIQVGQYDPQTNTFTNGAAPYSAVRATPSATITNQFMGMFGASYKTSTVTKTATAGFSGLGTGSPTLPLTIAACKFAELEKCFGTPGCLMPPLTLAPSGTDNSGWIKGVDVSCGDSGSGPLMTAGTTDVEVTDGTVGSTLQDVQGCGQPKQFLIPIVDASCEPGAQIHGTRKVVGFATIVVSCVAAKGNETCPGPDGQPVMGPDGKPRKGLNLSAIFKQVSGPAGGGAYGTGQMRLYN